jgi:hypothetical protein
MPDLQVDQNFVLPMLTLSGGTTVFEIDGWQSTSLSPYLGKIFTGNVRISEVFEASGNNFSASTSDVMEADIWSVVAEAGQPIDIPSVMKNVTRGLTDVIRLKQFQITTNDQRQRQPSPKVRIVPCLG